MNKIKGFFLGVKKEISMVRWPSKKEMVKYATATLMFFVFFALFFFLTDVVISFVKAWFK